MEITTQSCIVLTLFHCKFFNFNFIHIFPFNFLNRDSFADDAQTRRYTCESYYDINSSSNKDSHKNNLDHTGATVVTNQQLMLDCICIIINKSVILSIIYTN